jgi:hypothetical protein
VRTLRRLSTVLAAVATKPMLIEANSPKLVETIEALRRQLAELDQALRRPSLPPRATRKAG